MKCLLEFGNKYARQSDWTDFALVKFCLCAMGILIGIHIPTNKKKAVVPAAGAVFVAAYVSLMARVVKLALSED